MSSETRLVARGLSKSFGEVVALASADFELRPGEVMALIGENGAGKSTFVKIVCGIHKTDRGTVEIDGRPVALGSPSRAEKAGVAVVQQELSVVPTLSVAENVFLGQPSARFITGGRQFARAAAVHLESVGLDVDPMVPAGELPLAERQMLEIARVVSRDAGIILLDEPTAALSDDDIARVKDVVRKLTGAGRSVVYITHRLGEVFDLADRVTIFRDGRSQPPVDVTSLDSNKLITRMLGRPLHEMFPERAKSVGGVAMAVRELETAGLAEPVSFEVHRGEILGLAGQLGSGTTALLRGLSGTQLGVTGYLDVDGREVEIASPAGALAAGMAYCSGDRKYDGFFGIRRVTENITAPGMHRVTPMGILRPRAERRIAREIARMVGFDPSRIQHRVETLSGGNQQKVVLGKWLGAEPRVLLIDEPTRGVDVGARAEIYSTLRKLADDGLAIVFASSEMHEVLGLSDRIISFFRGRPVNEYPGDEATHGDLIRDITHPTAVAEATA